MSHYYFGLGFSRRDCAFLNSFKYSQTYKQGNVTRIQQTTAYNTRLYNKWVRQIDTNTLEKELEEPVDELVDEPVDELVDEHVDEHDEPVDEPIDELIA